MFVLHLYFNNLMQSKKRKKKVQKISNIK